MAICDVMLVRKQPYRHEKATEQRILMTFARYTKGDSLVAELFDPRDVFARDKWKCQSCGVSTPKKLCGTFHQNSPTLDHIVPRSLGGPHTMRNTQLLCLKCNHDKNHAQQLASLSKDVVQTKHGIISSVRLYAYKVILSWMMSRYGGAQ